jgi:hypothetical protein
MTDATTRERLEVSTDGNAGPYIMVPESQLSVVRALLDRNKIRYWVDEEVISLDGKPEIAFVNLGHGTNSQVVQKLLDSIP